MRAASQWPGLFRPLRDPSMFALPCLTLFLYMFVTSLFLSHSSCKNFLEANAKKFVEGGVTICESDQTSFRAFSNGAYRVDVSSHGVCSFMVVD